MRLLTRLAEGYCYACTTEYLPLCCQNISYQRKQCLTNTNMPHSSRTALRESLHELAQYSTAAAASYHGTLPVLPALSAPQICHLGGALNCISTIKDRCQAQRF